MAPTPGPPILNIMARPSFKQSTLLLKYEISYSFNSQKYTSASELTNSRNIKRFSNIYQPGIDRKHKQPRTNSRIITTGMGGINYSFVFCLPFFLSGFSLKKFSLSCGSISRSLANLNICRINRRKGTYWTRERRIAYASSPSA